VSDDQPTATYEQAPGSDGPAASRGETWIADGIVAKIAAAAAREVDGVVDLRGGASRRGWVRASERARGAAAVRVEEGAATVSLRLVVQDGVAIPAVVEAVRARVVERVEFATGMAVTRVDVGVVDVVPPPAPDAAPGTPADPEPAPAGA
jgi:uncharacterized alkaline shock family protein YloU